MVSLLLIISFLIHIVLFIAVYYLYTQLQNTKHNQDERLQEMLTNFIQEIRTENEQLQHQLVESSRKDTTINQTIPKHITSLLEKQKKETGQDEISGNQTSSFERVETSLEGQVLQLCEQGLSIEEIAKRLNKGKTEVELIVELNQRMIVNT